MDAEKTVFLVYASRRLLNHLLHSIGTRKQIPWMYLGTDVRFSQLLDALPSPLGPRVQFADELQKTALDKRQSFIDFIGELGPPGSTLAWWMTPISERSPFSSDVLLHFCYLSVCTEYVKGHPGDLVVFGESPGLLCSLQKNLKGWAGVRVILIDSPLLFHAESLLSMGKSLLRLGYYTLNTVGRIILARLFPPARQLPRAEGRGGTGTVVLYSWADGRSFPVPGRFHDAYLGRMDESVTRAGFDFSRLVQVMPTYSYVKAIKHLRAAKERIYLSEEFLSLLDPLRAIISILMHYPGFQTIPPWEGLDVSDIVLEEHRRSHWTIAPEKSYLAYLIARRAGSLLKPCAIVYPFENHSWEKLFCLGIREASPGTHLLGYAHATVPPLELSYSRSKERESGMPLPNLIFVNGEKSRDFLIDSGFDGNRVVVAGAFRYPGIGTLRGASREVSRTLILIATSIIFQESLELLFKCIKAFSDLEGREILIKFHPTLPFEHLSRHLPVMPSNMTVTLDSVDSLLPKAGVLISAGTSTVAFEALAHGVPYIHVRSDLALDLDILTGEDVEKSVSGSSELRETATRALRSPAPDPAEVQKLIGNFFSPVNMDIIEESIARLGEGRVVRLVVLDFDGVVLESVAIKTEAFRDLFASFPEHLDRIIEYHLNNLGTSRFDKVRYIYDTILGKDLPPDEYQRLITRYADLVLGKVLRAPFVPGALEFLERFHRRIPLYVVSATPQEEIRLIVKERGLSRYFRGVYGSPVKKADNLREILAASGTPPGTAVFVGDAPNDLHAARTLGMRFVGRVGPGERNLFSGDSSVERVVQDLHELGRYLEERVC